MNKPMSMFDLWNLSKMASRAYKGDCVFRDIVPPEERQAWCARVIAEWEQANALWLAPTGWIQ